MGQPDARSSHVIDIDAGASCCAVCMEPPEWVAVGRCGHREVCVTCAVRMRYFHDDRRCCICREFCPTVVVTKAGNTQQHVDFSKYCWYHGGMAAYFDNREQYKAVRNLCLKPPCSAGVSENPRATLESCSDKRLFILYLATMTLVGAAGGIPIAIHLKHWLQIVAIVLAFGLVSAVFACLFWKENPLIPDA